MEQETQIQKTESPQFESPIIRIAELVQQSNGKIDTAGMEKMMEMHFRYEADEAKKVFAADFAVAQSDMGAVVKTKNNSQTHSKYAGLENVLEMSKPVYTKHGFSIIFYEGKAEEAENIRVCADVLHKAGHKETYHFDVPLDGKGIKGNVNMTKIHGKASSVSYGRRYLLCMIWNIPTQDDDGNSAGKKPIGIAAPTDEEQEAIEAICIKIPHPDDKRVDFKKVAAICYEKEQSYPDMELVDRVVAWFAKFDRPEIFIPIPKDEFDEHIEGYNAEHTRQHSQPEDPVAREAEATAAAKIGKENEQVELRYYCTKCDKEFEEFKIKGVCVNTDCLSRDIIDMHKS